MSRTTTTWMLIHVHISLTHAYHVESIHPSFYWSMSVAMSIVWHDDQPCWSVDFSFVGGFIWYCVGFIWSCCCYFVSSVVCLLNRCLATTCVLLVVRDWGLGFHSIPFRIHLGCFSSCHCMPAAWDSPRQIMALKGPGPGNLVSIGARMKQMLVLQDCCLFHELRYPKTV